MRNRILGAVGVVWGGSILLSGLRGGVRAGSDAYVAGGIAGLAFGLLLFAVGAWYLIKGNPKKA